VKEGQNTLGIITAFILRAQASKYRCSDVCVYIYKLIFSKYNGIPRNEQTFFLYNLVCLLEEVYHFPVLCFHNSEKCLHIDESTAHIVFSVSLLNTHFC
jgi:hypothetical protein